MGRSTANTQEEPTLGAARALTDRRRSPRMPVGALMLYIGGSAYPGRGDISTGGAFWRGTGAAVTGNWVELGLRVGGLEQEARVLAEVLHVREVGEGLTGVHTRFPVLPSELEAAISRYIEEWFHIADASGIVSA